MRYIDKNIDALAGNQITKDYLDSYCRNAIGHYDGIQYSTSHPHSTPTFCNSGTPTFYSRMMSVLLHTQSNLCCYCLRRIKQNSLQNDTKASLEHIVPQTFTAANQADFDRYQAASPFLSNVQLTDVFEHQSGAQTLPPYPHKVAYDNMVASCNGTFPDCRDIGPDSQVCCNHGRGTKSAMPIYFWRDIEQLIDYTKDGGIFVKAGALNHDVIEEVILNAKLDYCALKDIRRVWYELSACDDLNTIRQCDTENKRDRLLTKYFSVDIALSNPRKSHELTEKFKKQEYWETLMLYDAFYNIMRKKYHPINPHGYDPNRNL